MVIVYAADIGGPNVRYRMRAYRVMAPPICCCNFMASEWGKLVDLSCVGHPSPENLSACLNIDFAAEADHIETMAIPIRFCPWCGEIITLEAATGENDDAQTGGGHANTTS